LKAITEITVVWLSGLKDALMASLQPGNCAIAVAAPPTVLRQTAASAVTINTNRTVELSIAVTGTFIARNKNMLAEAALEIFGALLLKYSSVY
jgi:hypothetical protein